MKTLQPMQLIRKLPSICISATLLFLFVSCDKEDLLPKKPNLEVNKETFYSIPFKIPAKTIDGNIELSGEVFPNADSLLKTIDPVLSVSDIQKVELLGLTLEIPDASPLANFDSLHYSTITFAAPGLNNTTIDITNGKPNADAGRKKIVATYSEKTLSDGTYNFWSNPPTNLQPYMAASKIAFIIKLNTFGGKKVSKPDLNLNVTINFKVSVVKEF
jgi:hypothetical protein